MATMIDPIRMNGDFARVNKHNNCNGIIESIHCFPYKPIMMGCDMSARLMKKGHATALSNDNEPSKVFAGDTLFLDCSEKCGKATSHIALITSRSKVAISPIALPK